MKITILTVGKPKKRLFRDGASLYLDRIGQYFSVEWINVPDSPHKDNKVMGCAIEGESILKKVKERDLVILLDENGKEFTSPDFAIWLEKRIGETQGRVVFVIGGPYGVSDQVRYRADHFISLSKMTLPHDLCVVFLAEQIYRACTIKAGTGYHH